MSKVTIDRDLAEACLEYIGTHGISGYALGLHDRLFAAISAPAGPLTAEECSAFAERLRAHAGPPFFREDGHFLARKIESIAGQLTALACVGPLPPEPTP